MCDLINSNYELEYESHEESDNELNEESDNESEEESDDQSDDQSEEESDNESTTYDDEDDLPVDIMIKHIPKDQLLEIITFITSKKLKFTESCDEREADENEVYFEKNILYLIKHNSSLPICMKYLVQGIINTVELNLDDEYYTKKILEKARNMVYY